MVQGVTFEMNLCQRIKIWCLVGLALLFIGLPTIFSYATSYESANILIGPNASDPDLISVDKDNYALKTLSQYMTPEDTMYAIVYVSEYNKGNVDAKQKLEELVFKYNPSGAAQVVNYILFDKNVKLLGSFAVNNVTNTLAFYPIIGLAESYDANVSYVANSFWEKFRSFAPVDFTHSISAIHIESNKEADNLATMVQSKNDASQFEINIDISLLDAANVEELNKYIIYLTTYYYILRMEQIEFLAPKKDNYAYAGHTYRDDSYINLFYKRFWKGRRKEVNISQYELYKNEFFDHKASRTVYDDMAVSYYHYIKNGIMRRYLGFRADKNNFFYDYPLFRDLAKEFRLKLGIIIA